MELHDGWSIRSSDEVEESGGHVSTPGYATTGWHAATVPTTVVAALVHDGTYPDPCVGMDLRETPRHRLRHRV